MRIYLCSSVVVATAFMACTVYGNSETGPDMDFYQRMFVNSDSQRAAEVTVSVTNIAQREPGKMVCTFKATDGKSVAGRTEWKWEWNEKGRPIPLQLGQQNVWINVDSQGRVHRIGWRGWAILMRKRPIDRQIEYVIASDLVRTPDGGEKPRPPYLRIWPNYANIIASLFNASVKWDDHFGLIVALWEAGDEETEKELEAARRRGIPVANDPSARIFPGRDGWRKIQQSDLDEENPAPPEQRFIKSR